MDTNENKTFKLVNVELLRPGPRHNQLLSPITQYLSICGDNPAGVVTVPFEHAQFQRLTDELRYEVSSSQDASRVAAVLDEAGTKIAKMLAGIPGLPGLFNKEKYVPCEFTHLRLTLSASELALLPFELSKIPVGGGAEPDDTIALYQQHPTCLTRHIRSVTTEGIEWLIAPRILYVCGPGHDVPFVEHLTALIEATKPWLTERQEPEKKVALKEINPVYENALLTALNNPSISEIRETFARGGYTHLHILAHGAEDPESNYQSYGIHLDNEVVSGEDLATTLGASKPCDVLLPRVVTLATCDSAAGGDVIVPDSSVAFDLHRRGVPLVIASQFPLSIEGSIPFVETFYKEQLQGIHPLETMYKLRLRLYSDFGRHFHDWASLVIYEALPENFPLQLEKLCYWQMRKAQENALDLLEGSIKEIAREFPNGWDDRRECGIKSLLDYVSEATKALPMDGAFEAECIGLKAAYEKRLAGIAFNISLLPDLSTETKEWYLKECQKRLEACLPEYKHAAGLFLSPTERLLQRKANLHWLLTQVISIELILGNPFNQLAWNAALYSAENAMNDGDDVTHAWSHSSLGELYLVRLADSSLEETERESISKKAEWSAEQLVELVGRAAEQATSTARQFQRYVDWWGHSQFTDFVESAGFGTRAHWLGQHGVIEVAKRLVAILRGDTKPPSDSNPPLQGGKKQSKKGNQKKKATRTKPAKPLTQKRSAPGTTRKLSGEHFSIEMLPAENGDCLWVEYGTAKTPHRMLIDCGAVSAAALVRNLIRQRAGDGKLDFELFVLTHIDSDHISGAIPLFEDASLPARFGDIWFNGWQQLRGFLSVRQGEQFSNILSDKKRGLNWNRAFTPSGTKQASPVVVQTEHMSSIKLQGGMKITLLSPTEHELTLLARRWGAALAEFKRKGILSRRAPPAVRDFDSFPLEELANKRPKKDSSVPNASSIAFLAEYGGRSALFTGDAHASVLAASIRSLQKIRGATDQRLKLNALKLSHHGSANALTRELLDVIDCDNYLIPTDGSTFYHPDREAVSRIVLWGGAKPRLYFNYRSDLNKLWANAHLQKKYGYTAEYPKPGETGLRIDI